MILSFVIKNTTASREPLDPGEAWKFVVQVDDEGDAYNQIGKVKMNPDLVISLGICVRP